MVNTYNYYEQFSRSGSTGIGILDALSITGGSSARGLYDMRRLRTGYTGPTIAISAGGTLTNFYADYEGTVLGTGLGGTGTNLETWLGPSTGNIAIWYDQSGWGRNATQGNILYQPAYVKDLKTISFMPSRSTNTTRFPTVSLTANTQIDSRGISYTAGASSVYQAFQPYLVFNNVFSDFWHSIYPNVYNTFGNYIGTVTTGTNIGTISGEWISISMSECITLKLFTIVPRAGFSSRAPNSFVLAGRRRGIANFTVIYNTTSTSNWQDNTVSTFDVSGNTLSFNEYILIVRTLSQNTQTDSVQIAEWTLYGIESPFMQFTTPVIPTGISPNFTIVTQLGYTTGNASSLLSSGVANTTQANNLYVTQVGTFFHEWWNNNITWGNSATNIQPKAVATITFNGSARNAYGNSVLLATQGATLSYSLSSGSQLIGRNNAVVLNYNGDLTSLYIFGSGLSDNDRLICEGTGASIKDKVINLLDYTGKTGGVSSQIRLGDKYQSTISFEFNNIGPTAANVNTGISCFWGSRVNNPPLESANNQYSLELYTNGGTGSNRATGIGLYKNGTRLVYNTTGSWINSPNWNTLSIKMSRKVKDTISINYAGNLLFTYSDPAVENWWVSSGNFMGFNSYTSTSLDKPVNFPATNPVVALDIKSLSILQNNSHVDNWADFNISSNQRPTYIDSGGYTAANINLGYVSFRRAETDYLDGGTRTFNMATNGGFTAVALVRFTGTSGTWERIFDFGSGSPDNNIFFTRLLTTNNLRFEYYNGSASGFIITSTSNPIVQNEWAVFSCRYTHSSRAVQLFKNGIQIISETASTAATDRTVTNTWIGRSNWSVDAYSNVDIGGLYVYDSALTDQQITAVTTYMTSTLSNNFNIRNFSITQTPDISTTLVKATGYTLPENCLLNRLSGDSQSNCVGAYSYRLLSSTYTGPQFRVRRAGDNAETDFYADAFGNLGNGLYGSGTSLTSWLSGAIGYVTRWYDQSGYERDLVQTNTTAQPQITVDTSGVRIIYNGTSNFLSTNNFGLISAGNKKYTYFATWNPTARTDNLGGTSTICGHWTPHGAAASNNRGALTHTLNSNLRFGFTGKNNDAPNLVYYTPGVTRRTAMICNHTLTSGNIRIWDNGTLYTGTTEAPSLLVLSSSVFTVGSNSLINRGEYFNGTINEIIVFNTAVKDSDATIYNTSIKQETSMAIYPKPYTRIDFSPITTNPIPDNNGTKAVVALDMSALSGIADNTPIQNNNSSIIRGYSVYPPASVLIPTSLDVQTLSGLSNGASVTDWNGFIQTTGSVAPTYVTSGGLNGSPYVSFNRANSQFLDGKSRTFNMATNGGFTAVALTRFTGTAGFGERIFDFGNTTGNNNILVKRVDTTSNLQFYIQIGTTANIAVVASSAIVQNEWAVWAFRYRHSDRNMSIWKNGTQITSGTGGTPATDRTVTRNWIGQSQWAGDAYSNIDIGGFYAYDASLTDADITSMSSYLLNINTPTATVPSNLYIVSASSQFGNISSDNSEIVTRAFDKNVSTRWTIAELSGSFYDLDGNYIKFIPTITSARTTSGSVVSLSGEWLQVQTPVSFNLISYEIIPQLNDLSRSPKNFWLLGSTSGSTWNIIDTQTGVTNWTTSGKIFNTVNNTTQYNFYRLVVNSNNGSSWLSIVELELYGSPSSVQSIPAAPTFKIAGGWSNDMSYLSFNRGNSQFLNMGTRSFNIATNGGFTAVALVRFTGTAGAGERIFDFGNGNASNNIIFTRTSNTTGNLQFEYYNDSTSGFVISSTTTPIIQNEWAVFSCRYTHSSRVVQLFKNGTQITSGTASTSATNRTVNNCFIGRSNWTADAYSNIDIGGLYVYDYSLSNAEMSAITNHLILNSCVTNVPQPISDYSSTYVNITTTGGSVISLPMVNSGISSNSYVGYFNGNINSFMDIRNIPAIPLSYCGWVNFTSTDYSVPFALSDFARTTGNVINIDYPTATNVLTVYAAIPTRWSSYSINNVYPNTWNHICITLDTNYNVGVYFNGVLQTTLVGTDYPTSRSRLIVGGAGNAHSGFTGFLSDVRVYDYILSADDVSKIYTSTNNTNITKTITNNKLNYIVNNGNWTNKMVVVTAGSYIPQVSGSDPNKIYQLTRDSIINSSNILYNNLRVQDSESFTCSFHINVSNRYPDVPLSLRGATRTTSANLITYTFTNVNSSGNYIVSTSSEFADSHNPVNLFNNSANGTSSTYDIYACASNRYLTVTGSYAAYSGSISTTISGLGNYLGEWIQIQLPRSIVLTRFVLYPRTDTFTQYPTKFHMVGSTDGTTWTSLYNQSTTITDWTQIPRTFMISSPTTAFNYYRLICNEVMFVSTGSFFALSELELYGGGEAVWFFAGANTVGNQLTESTPLGGYTIDFQVNPSSTSASLGVGLFGPTGATGGTLLAQSYNTQFLNNNTTFNWCPVVINYNRGAVSTWTINVGGKDIITYSDPNNATWIPTSGGFWGIGARTGSTSGMNSAIRNLEMSCVPYETEVSELIGQISYTPQKYPGVSLIADTSITKGGMTWNTTGNYYTTTAVYSSVSSGNYTGATSTTVSGITYLGEYLQLQYTDVTSINGYIVSVPSGQTSSAPKKWILAGSNTGNQSDWTLLDSQTAVTNWSVTNTIQTFGLGSVTTVNPKFKYYRLIAQEVNGGTAFIIANLQIIDNTANQLGIKYPGSLVKYTPAIDRINQDGTAQWATRIAGNAIDRGYSVVVGSDNSVYITGEYSSNPLSVFNVDGSTAVTLGNSGNGDIFLVKYNPSGTAQWATRIGGTALDTCYSIAVGGDGVYVTGAYYSNPVSVFNSNGSTAFTMGNSGDSDIFLVKYNFSGTAQWVARIGGSVADYQYSVAVGSDGVYISGTYASNPLSVFNSDTTTGFTLGNIGGNDTFIAKYNFTGTAQWVGRIGGTGNEGSSSQPFGQVTVGADGIYLTGGYTSNPVTVYNTDASTAFTLSNSGSNFNVFIVKYNFSGTPQWATRLGGDDEIGSSIGVGTEGVYVSGWYRSTLLVYNIDGTNAFSVSNNTTGTYDTFIVKYSFSGTSQWGTRVGGSGNEFNHSIAVGNDGVYIGGYFLSNTLPVYNTNESTVFSMTNTNSNFSDGYLVKYNFSGTPQWVTRIGGTGDDRWNSISVGEDGVYITGFYTSNPLSVFNVDGSTAFTLGNSGSSDGFIVKYNLANYIPNASSVSGNAGAANAFDTNPNSYWHSNGGQYNVSTGTYLTTGTLSTTDTLGTIYRGEWLQITLPRTIRLAYFTITGRQHPSLYAHRSPRNFNILGSNNGSTWTLVYTQTDYTAWTILPSKFTVNSTVSYSYYRLVVSRVGIYNTTGISQDCVNIAEWQLYEADLGVNNTASSQNDTNLSSNAFDGSLTTFWESSTGLYNNSGTYTGTTSITVNSVVYAGEWLQTRLDNPIRLSYFNIFPNVSSVLTKSPRNFVLLGSNNDTDDTAWNLVYSGSYTWTSGQMVAKFNVNCLTPYSSYRLITSRVGTSDSNAGQNSVQIASFELFEMVTTLATLYDKTFGLIEGATWKLYDKYYYDSTEFFDKNPYKNIGLTTNLSNVNTITRSLVNPNDTSYTNYSLEILGYFRADVTGTYTFYLASNDASYLWIGDVALAGYTTGTSGNAIVKNGGTHVFTEIGGTTGTLTAGTFYPIRILWGSSSNNSGDCQISFIPPGGSRTYDWSRYIYSSTGTNRVYPAPSAKVIKDITGTNTDGVYYINADGNSAATYCLMNDIYGGGGWMMLMKGTRGTTFNYNSNYWQGINTLNSSDTTRADGDAKFDVFNYVPIKDVMAIFPDVPSDSYTNIYGNNGGSLNLPDGWCWKVDNWYNASFPPYPLSGTSTLIENIEYEIASGSILSSTGRSPWQAFDYKFTDGTEWHSALNVYSTTANTSGTYNYVSTTTTTVDNQTQVGDYLQIKIAKPVYVDRIGMVQRQNFVNRMPRSFVLAGSNDNGQTWTTVHDTADCGAWTGYGWRYFTLTKPGSYSAYRLIIRTMQGSDGTVNIGEMRLFASGTATALIGFNDSRDAHPSNPNHFTGFSSSLFSSQTTVFRHVFGNGLHAAIDSDGTTNTGVPNVKLRWGLMFNNEADFKSCDVAGGIGIYHNNTVMSAGDFYFCCGTSGVNRTMRFEMYGR